MMNTFLREGRVQTGGAVKIGEENQEHRNIKPLVRIDLHGSRIQHIICDCNDSNRFGSLRMVNVPCQ